MSEWMNYLGWLVAVFVVAIFGALSLVQKPPYEENNRQWTIAFYADNAVHLLTVYMNNPSEAEGLLRMFEDAYRDTDSLEGVYDYEILGVIKGHHTWEKNYNASVNSKT